MSELSELSVPTVLSGIETVTLFGNTMFIWQYEVYLAIWEDGLEWTALNGGFKGGDASEKTSHDDETMKQEFGSGD